MTLLKSVQGHACLALALTVMTWASAEAAIVLPDAFYRQDLTYPTAQHHFGPGSISVDEDWYSGGGVYRGHVSGSAASWGGLLPSADVFLEVYGSGLAAIDGEASAGLTYYWTVERIAGEPRSTVPVLIHTVGSTSAATVGDAAISPYYAMAVFNFIGSTSTFLAGVYPGTCLA